jgi:hypothetical protein
MTLVLIGFQFLGCSVFQRHENSGYLGYETTSSENDAENFYQNRENNEKTSAYSELELNSSKPLSENETLLLNLRLKLNRMEKNIVTEKEKRQYYFYKPMLKTDSERIRFLSINSIEGRERYANQLDLVKKFNDFNDHTLKLIEENDIAVGMNQQAVKESWGDPDLIEVSGSEVYGNQAWKYTKMVSSNDGYKKETRIIYFESGKVIGWDTL